MLNCIKTILIIPFLFSYLFSQTGKISIRKTNSNLIGKTLQLNDLRGTKAGTIKFTNKTNCTVNFILKLENTIIQSDFNQITPKTETFNCSYSIINDTLLAFSYKKHNDTCYYKYINDNINLVQFKNTIYGLYSKSNNFAIFYHFDSIIYSQTYNKVLTDTAFNRNLNLDSIYKDVKDNKIRKELQKELNSEMNKYNKNIVFNYFKGNFLIIKNKINLIKNNNHFAYLTIQKDTTVNIFCQYILDGSLPLTGEYLKDNYATIVFKYDSAFTSYRMRTLKNDSITLKTVKGSDYLANHTNLNSVNIFNKKETITIKRNNYTNICFREGMVIGNIETYIKSLNSKFQKFKNFYFTLNGAYELDKNYSKVDNIKWKYTISDSALFIYNNKDTLVDERSLFFNRVYFTYKNNNAIIFGVYHYKTTLNKHEFLILYNNNTGIKYTSNTFNYKQARKSLQKNKAINTLSKNIKHFTFTSSKENLWLTFNNGNYYKLDLFNYSKAIRDNNAEKIKNYYLVE